MPTFLLRTSTIRGVSYSKKKAASSSCSRRAMLASAGGGLRAEPLHNLCTLGEQTPTPTTEFLGASQPLAKGRTGQMGPEVRSQRSVGGFWFGRENPWVISAALGPWQGLWDGCACGQINSQRWRGRGW